MLFIFHCIKVRHYTTSMLGRCIWEDTFNPQTSRRKGLSFILEINKRRLRVVKQFMPIWLYVSKIMLISYISAWPNHIISEIGRKSANKTYIIMNLFVLESHSCFLCPCQGSALSTAVNARHSRPAPLLQEPCLQAHLGVIRTRHSKSQCYSLSAFCPFYLFASHILQGLLQGVELAAADPLQYSPHLKNVSVYMSLEWCRAIPKSCSQPSSSD